MAADPLPLPGPVSTATAETPALSQGARIIDTFIAPKKTFQDIRRSSQWWLPFLLMALSFAALIYVAEQKIGTQKLVENDLQAQPKRQAQFEKLTPEVQQQQIKISGIIYYIAFPVITLLVWLT